MNRLRNFLTGFAKNRLQGMLTRIGVFTAITTNAFVYIRASKKICCKRLI